MISASNLRQQQPAVDRRSAGPRWPSGTTASGWTPMPKEAAAPGRDHRHPYGGRIGGRPARSGSPPPCAARAARGARPPARSGSTRRLLVEVETAPAAEERPEALEELHTGGKRRPMCASDTSGGGVASARSATGERLRLLRRDPRLEPGRERRRAEAEVAVVLRCQPLEQPAGGLLDPAELLEPPGELLAASSGSRSASSTCSSGNSSRAFSSSSAPTSTRNSPHASRSSCSRSASRSTKVTTTSATSTSRGSSSSRRTSVSSRSNGPSNASRSSSSSRTCTARRLAARADAALGDGHRRPLRARGLRFRTVGLSPLARRNCHQTKKTTEPMHRTETPRSSAARRGSGATGRCGAAPRTCGRRCRRRRRARTARRLDPEPPPDQDQHAAIDRS